MGTVGRNPGTRLETGTCHSRVTEFWHSVSCQVASGAMGEASQGLISLLNISLEPRRGIPEDKPTSWFLWGKTGTGKTRRAFELAANNSPPTCYCKDPNNKWWDGYQGEEIVVIEEWEPKNECTASKLKIWADRYPFAGEIKGGTLQKIRPRKIIVTSNYTI